MCPQRRPRCQDAAGVSMFMTAGTVAPTAAMQRQAMPSRRPELLMAGLPSLSGGSGGPADREVRTQPLDLEQGGDVLVMVAGTVRIQELPDDSPVW